MAGESPRPSKEAGAGSGVDDGSPAGAGSLEEEADGSDNSFTFSRRLGLPDEPHVGRRLILEGFDHYR